MTVDDGEAPPVTTTLAPAADEIDEETRAALEAARVAFADTDPPPTTTAANQTKPNQTKPNEMADGGAGRSEAPPRTTTAPVDELGEKRRGRPPLPRDATGNIIREGSTAAPKTTPVEPAKGPTVQKHASTGAVPDKFKQKKLKKGEHRPNWTMSEALENATDADRKWVRENYRDEVLKGLPQMEKFMIVLEPMALHCFMYYRQLLDPNILISSIGAGVPLLGSLAIQVMTERGKAIQSENDIRAQKIRDVACPFEGCKAAVGTDCKDAPAGVYHGERWTAAGVPLPPQEGRK
jgi:hypothetical protein